MYLNKPEVLWTRVTRMPNGCLIYNKPRSDGYGHISVARKQYLTHRLSWEITFGPIPVDSLVLHKCDNKPCVEPDHLFLGTTQDNINDKVTKNRQMQGEGHWNAKLTLDQVTEIKTCPLKYKEISARYQIGFTQISRIKHGTRWKV